MSAYLGHNLVKKNFCLLFSISRHGPENEGVMAVTLMVMQNGFYPFRHRSLDNAWTAK